MPTELERLTVLTDITLQLGQVERLTRDKEGNNESVTTHSHMLALVVLEVAPRVAKDDLKLPETAYDTFIKQCLSYALVHDLPEYKHGDVPTLRTLSPEERERKEVQELRASKEIFSLLGEYTSFVGCYLNAYERQSFWSERLVHLLDKMMPKLVLIANEGNLDPALEMTVEELVTLHNVQQEKLRNEYLEFPSVHELFNLACRECERVYANRLIASFGGQDYFPFDEEF